MGWGLPLNPIGNLQFMTETKLCETFVVYLKIDQCITNENSLFLFRVMDFQISQG